MLVLLSGARNKEQGQSSDQGETSSNYDMNTFNTSILLLRLLSVLCCIVALLLSYLFKLPPGRRTSIQRNRAFTLGLMICLVILYFLVLHRLLFLDDSVIIAIAAGIAWFYTCHMIWTICEGIEVYRVLVKKQLLEEQGYNWMSTIAIYLISALLALLPLLTGRFGLKMFEFLYEIFMGPEFVAARWYGQRKVVLSLLFIIVPSTIAMTIANSAILALVLWAIKHRTKSFGRLTRHNSEEPSSLKQVLTALALSTILGLNLGTCVLSFSRSEVLKKFGAVAFSFSGIVFFLQFVLCNHRVKQRFRLAF